MYSEILNEALKRTRLEFELYLRENEKELAWRWRKSMNVLTTDRILDNLRSEPIKGRMLVSVWKRIEYKHLGIVERDMVERIELALEEVA